MLLFISLHEHLPKLILFSIQTRRSLEYRHHILAYCSAVSTPSSQRQRARSASWAEREYISITAGSPHLETQPGISQCPLGYNPQAFFYWRTQTTSNFKETSIYSRVTPARLCQTRYRSKVSLKKVYTNPKRETMTAYDKSWLLLSMKVLWFPVGLSTLSVYCI